MRKIAVITIYRNINYGSALQAYALQATVKEIGYQCEHLKYHQNNKKHFFSKLVSVIKRPSRIFGRLFQLGLRRRGCKFRAFINQHVEENPRPYTSIDELRSTNDAYDVFICGSDQIWAPNQFNEWYYLSFVDKEHKKVAYAPSVGLPVIPDDLKSRMTSLIKGIPYLSVREKQGADIINELTSIEVPVVLDPTLLVSKDRWISMATETRIKEEYILCYFLGDNPKHRDLVDKYKQRTGHKTVVLPFAACDCSWGDISLKDTGPLEFVGLVNNARIVFTDSFHGTLFSINLNKRFNVFMRFKEDDVLCQNSRIVNILEMFGLSHRLISDDCLEITDDSDIEYESVNKMLESKREYSIDYLRTSLMESIKWSEKNDHV